MVRRTAPLRGQRHARSFQKAHGGRARAHRVTLHPLRTGKLPLKQQLEIRNPSSPSLFPKTINTSHFPPISCPRNHTPFSLPPHRLFSSAASDAHPPPGLRRRPAVSALPSDSSLAGAPVAVCLVA
ncbi:hypothetical protein NL676_010144 [Syzygium grande]|nr:hypothetical protein NL676_010144 [Syzygium grande]